MELNHVSLPTGRNHFKHMRDFYLNILSPFGYHVLTEHEGGFCGFQSRHRGPDFWLHRGEEEFPPIDRNATADEITKGRGRTHLGFELGSRRLVDEWYRNALKHGGIANGEPGERPWVQGWYAAYVLDPLGNNVEAFYFPRKWMNFKVKLRANASKIGLGAIAVGIAAVFARASGWV